MGHQDEHKKTVCAKKVKTKKLKACKGTIDTLVTKSITLNGTFVSVATTLQLQTAEATCDTTATGVVTSISHGNGLYTVELYLSITASSAPNTGCSFKLNWNPNLPTFNRVFTVFKQVDSPTFGRVVVDGDATGLTVTLDSELEAGMGYNLQETFLLV